MQVEFAEDFNVTYYSHYKHAHNLKTSEDFVLYQVTTPSLRTLRRCGPQCAIRRTATPPIGDRRDGARSLQARAAHREACVEG